MTKPLPRICIVGQLVGRNKGFIPTQGQVLADLLEQEGYEVVSVSSKLNRALRLWEVVQTIIQKRRSTDLLIIEVYSGLSFLLADIASLTARAFGLPVVFVLHGGNLPEFGERYPAWTRRVLRRARYLVAPSSFLATKMAAFGDYMTVIPNIISFEKYNYRRRGLIKPRILWMRSFHDIYNPKLALESFALIKERFPEATLVMAGPDKGKLEETMQMARSLGVAESVRFPGFLDEVQKSNEFDQADIFLNTTRIDNMPVGIVEACAAGLPVVATDVGGISALLTDRLSGMLVKSADPRDISNAVTELLMKPDLAETLSRNGKSVADNSAWPNVLAQWRELFEKVLGSDDLIAADRSQEGLRQREHRRWV
ncbi:MAG TPA: glycosyltransferase family 4 protein [Pyrinomonadaceae bacterium]